MGDPFSQLMQTPIQPPQQSTIQNIGGMLQGLGAGFQGQPDPRIAQQQMMMQQQEMSMRQQEGAMRQKLQLMQIQQGVERQRLDKMRVQKDIASDFLNQDSQVAKQFGARIYSGILQSQGVDPELLKGFEQGLGSSPMNLDKRKQVYLSIRTNAPDDYLVEHLGVDKAMLPQLKREAQSDEVYKLLYGKTPAQEQTELVRVDLERRRVDMVEEGRRLDQLKLDRQIAKDERQAKESDIKISQAERRLRLSEESGNRQQAKLDYMLAAGPDEKRQKALDGAELFISQFQASANALDSKGFLPKTSKGVIGGLLSNEPSAIRAQSKRATDPNDPDWVNFTKELKNQMVGYSRSVQNDIGPRAMQAFQGGIDLMEKPPSLEALDKVVRTMRQAVDISRKGQDTAQTLYIRKPTGQIIVVPWKRGMVYDEGDRIIKVE